MKLQLPPLSSLVGLLANNKASAQHGGGFAFLLGVAGPLYVMRAHKCACDDWRKGLYTN